MNKILLINSENYDAYFNIALEEYLVNKYNATDEKYYILYLWQNNNAVIVGRNQNPYNECLVEELERLGTKLVRRNTGGGAVFHDKGNLNFSIITPRQYYSIERSLNIIKRALAKFGIEAVYSGRNDLLVNGAKFSGNAFFVNEHAGLHHGTLLVNTDFGKLAHLLTVSKDKLEPKGISSVKSRVINLRQVCEDITIEELCVSLQKEFKEEYGIGEMIEFRGNEVKRLIDNDEFISLYKKYSSDIWNYGERYSYNRELYQRFAWGGCEIKMLVREHKILRCSVYSDALEIDTIEYIRKKLTNAKGITRGQLEEIKKEMYAETQVDKIMLKDIIGLVSILINSQGDKV